MAPGTDAAKVLQGHRQRPSAHRNIVPAIPLPYIQKRKQQNVAPKRVDEEFNATPPRSTPPSSSPSPAVDTTQATSNGTPETNSTHKGDEEAPQAAAMNTTTDVVLEMEEREISEVTPVTLEDEVQNTPPVSSPNQKSSDSPSTYNMPAPFVPGNHGYSSSTADAVKFPAQPSLGGQFPMHHTQPSTGSLVFGGYPESNNSSPAPPASARGIGQLPSQPSHETGRNHGNPYSNGGHMHTFSNGYSPMGPPGPAGYYPRQENFNQNPGPDNYARRQMPGGFMPHEAYSPSGTPAGVEHQRFPPFDPSTPHSFHGSQSSAADVNGSQYYIQYAPAVNSNGSNNHAEDVRLYNQPRTKGRPGSQPLVAAQGPNMSQSLMPPALDDLDGLVGYIQSQFGEPQFADYTLELRYSDDRASPVRIPGHNLLFARSPTLKKLMTAQAQESNSDGLTLRTLFIQSEDRFLRSDGFSMAVNRLYGGPLLDPGASALISTSAVAQQSSAIPGTPADRFEVALGYAAAGHILQIPPVVNRGIDIASHFVSWVTLEKALDFALDGGLDSRWTLDNAQTSASSSTYGEAVNMIIHSALNFIITSFPPNFELDVTVGEPAHNRRIPLVVETRPAPPNPRLSSIKFGDHSSDDHVRSPVGTSITTILSKVLINLPFQLLKYILESPRLGNVHGWATTDLRKKVMRTVVEEREKRRNKAWESKSVSTSERYAKRQEWDAVGWQESLVPIQGAPETSALHRTWIGFEF